MSVYLQITLENHAISALVTNVSFRSSVLNIRVKVIFS